MEQAHTAPARQSTHTRISRREIKRKYRGRRGDGTSISTSIFTILALTSLAAAAAAAGFARSGGGRRVVGLSVGGGLLQKIYTITGVSSGEGKYGYGAFVSAAPITLSYSRSSTTTATATESSASAEHEPPTIAEMASSESCTDTDNDITPQVQFTTPSKATHPNDSSLWMYHVESTTSTMDESKRIVEKKFLVDNDNGTADIDDDDISSSSSRNGDDNKPSSFLISATSQTNGRGTTKRNWKSSQRGNALFTIGIRQSSWMKDLKSKNNGRMVPLTLLPLKVGSVVAFHIQKALQECTLKSSEDDEKMKIPKATVKWPNDVLLHNPTTTGSSPSSSHEKIAGILIESSQDWFLIGIGINVGYAPTIPTEGADYGRKATCLSNYCIPPPDYSGIEKGQGRQQQPEKHEEEEEYWIELSKKLAQDIAHDLHSWLHPHNHASSSLSSSSSSAPTRPAFGMNVHSGEAILNQWKSYIDWDMELILRDTPKRERVKLKDILEDGRVVVQEVDGMGMGMGASRTLVADYFL